MARFPFAWDTTTTFIHANCWLEPWTKRLLRTGELFATSESWANNTQHKLRLNLWHSSLRNPKLMPTTTIDFPLAKLSCSSARVITFTTSYLRRFADSNDFYLHVFLIFLFTGNVVLFCYTMTDSAEGSLGELISDTFKLLIRRRAGKNWHNSVYDRVSRY